MIPIQLWINLDQIKILFFEHFFKQNKSFGRDTSWAGFFAQGLLYMYQRGAGRLVLFGVGPSVLDLTGRVLASERWVTRRAAEVNFIFALDS